MNVLEQKVKIKYTDRDLKSLLNEMNCLWTGIFITGGGALALLYTEINVLKIILCIFGLFLCTSFIMNYFDRRMKCDYIKNYLNSVESDNE